ncbi:DNA helicase-2 / ATP-dependent DNA helicase PcrA [Paenibacillus catalpae]|uniref:DNA helicase-2 / ATP-dependent DNA helicase PcrA n=1 Tax=Paenibacillus catalpae TaxID=1045775 RepID=A0A1I1VEQ3_9BACL|nr:RNA polymerase recycling motor HelD [Paenibacillus catalpae]SFD81349.1 DNA helicase-2 / ATP-dependent DNA helicase PcrA [Paenibacillus catalpae]
MMEKEWKLEQDRLNKVTEKLKERMAELQPEVDQLYGQASDMRRHFWEEVTVNTSTEEDFEESYFSIKQQVALLSERERSHQKRLQQWKNMKRLLQSPYFGRIDFTEKGLGHTEQVYIGVSSFLASDGMDFLIYDWRTPIASLYYDHSPGPAAYATPGGLISGTMELKRQYQIKGNELINFFDASVTIGDSLLQQVLGQGANNQMKSIVATIQKEQNAIIRNDSSRMLIVQGAAGSGKTSAALQRVAYLLYKHRERLKADQIVLFSPNSMFNSYVSTVLPELGEENMQQTTFQEYLGHWLGGEMQLEDPFDQIEYVLTAQETEGYEARIEGIRYKASEAFLHALQHYAEWLGKEGMRFTGIRFQNRDLITAEQIAEQFYSYDASVRLSNRVILLQEWLLKELKRIARREQEADWVGDELDYLDNDQYAEAYSELLKKFQRDEEMFEISERYAEVQDRLRKFENLGEDNVFDFSDQQEVMLRQMIVKEHFKPLRRMVKRMKFVDINGLYGQLFDEKESAYLAMTDGEEVPPHWLEIARQTREKLGREELYYEDATPYLFLKELIEGARMNTIVRHIFVDEGQDYSPFQYAFLKRLFPNARMTVLGDFGQAIFTQSTNLQGGDTPLVRLYGESETSLIALLRSYRSTKENVEFTRSMLPGGEEIQPFDRRGRKPVITTAHNRNSLIGQLAHDLKAMKAEGLGSIAVITKTAAESKEAYEALTALGLGEIRLVTKDTLTFETGAMVIPAYLAKGVEFDAVLIYDASSEAYNRESERKLFYTACTRAMHLLNLYIHGEWAPYLNSVNKELYEVQALE